MVNYKIIVGGISFGLIILAMFIISLVFLSGALDKIVDKDIKHVCMIVFSILPALISCWVFGINLYNWFCGGKSSAITGVFSFIIGALMIAAIYLGAS